MSLNPIGKNLQIFGEECEYTQQHLANMLNIDRSTYFYYESGRMTLDIPSLIMLSQVFSVSLSESPGQEDTSPMPNDSSPGKSGSKRVADNNSHTHDLEKDELQLIVLFRVCMVREKEEPLQKAAEIQSKNKKKELD